MTHQEKHEAFTLKFYKDTTYSMGAVRSGLGDAAHMCDAIARDILSESGPGKLRRAEAVKRAGDAIWALWEKILADEQPPTNTEQKEHV